MGVFLKGPGFYNYKERLMCRNNKDGIFKKVVKIAFRLHPEILA